MTQTEYGCGVVPEYRIFAMRMPAWYRSQRSEWDNVHKPYCEGRGYKAQLQRRLIQPDGTAGEWEVIDSVNCGE